MCRMDKQQGSAAEHRELHWVSCDKPFQKWIWKRTYVCLTESLCCIAEINAVNQLYFNKTHLKQQEALVYRRSFQPQHPCLWLEESVWGAVLCLVGCFSRISGFHSLDAKSLSLHLWPPEVSPEIALPRWELLRWAHPIGLSEISPQAKGGPLMPSKWADCLDSREEKEPTFVAYFYLHVLT